MNARSFAVAARRAVVSLLPLSLALASALPAAAASDVVISQVYGGGGNTGATYKNDFIELFNRGAVAVDLAGWSLQYASATGTSWTNQTTLSGTIQPGQYFLVQEAAGTGGTTNLPTPDVIDPSPIALAATAGKVALLSNSTTITSGTSCPVSAGTAGLVDFVGFGATANCFEGTAATPAPSNTTSVSRAGGGCTDTDDNSADFAAGSVTPRNTSSSLTACAGVEAAPFVHVTSPANGATGVALDANLTITFSEDVSVTGDWFQIACPTSGTRAVADTSVSGGPKAWTIDPSSNFSPLETCLVTVYAAQITDADANDPPDTMAADKSYSFTVQAPSTPPTGTGAASPSAVLPGEDSLLTVSVTPGSLPTSTGLAVAADLTAIGGSGTQSFFDDGTNGDATSGDNVFSFLASVAGGTGAGAKSMPATISDAELRTGTASIPLTILPPLADIHDVQGSGLTSPKVGQQVTVEGIVTGVKSNGFFVQAPDAEADADPDTSEGIQVFTSSTPPAAAAIGAVVRAAGTVAEFIPSADPDSPPLTEITGPTVVQISTGNPLPTPATIGLADLPTTGTAEQLERLEGMRVSVASLSVVSPTGGSINESNATSTSNGVFYGVITGAARPFREPGLVVGDPLPAGSPCCVPRWDGSPERLRVDSDGQTGAAALNVSTGDVVTDLVGPLDYGFRTYTVLPDAATPPTLVSSGLAALPVRAAAGDELTVASFNMQRFFDTSASGLGEPVLTPTAFDNRLNKASLAIRDLLRTPDILAVQEVENLTTLQAIAARVNADAVLAGDPDPAYAASLEEGNDPGGIDVGFLVKTARASVVDVTQEGLATTYINPNNSQPELLNDRPPLVLRASVDSGSGPVMPLTVIAVHNRSLSSVNSATDGNRVRTKRRAQAEFLAALIQARQAADSSEHIVALGDYNAFEFNDGYVDSMGTIKGTPTAATDVVLASSDLVTPDLTNLVEGVPAADRYSYTFDGSAQNLDQALVTANLAWSVRELEHARNGADFPEPLRNDPSRPERLSDHDPMVAFLAFDATPPSVTLTAPNGGQSVYAGSPLQVSWTGSDNDALASFDVAYSTDGGSTFTPVAECTGLAKGATSCEWASAGPVGSNLRMRVTAHDLSGNTGSDASDASFSVVAGPTFTLSAPASSATSWGYATHRRISWKYAGMPGSKLVNLRLSADGGATFPYLLATVPAGQLSALVTVPTLPGPTAAARLRVEFVEATQYHADNPTSFKVEAPFVTVVSPNGGETWHLGRTAVFRWLDNLGSLERVRITLSTDGGATFPALVVYQTAADGTFSRAASRAWRTTSGRARIAWTSDAAVSDVSDADFSVVKP